MNSREFWNNYRKEEIEKRLNELKTVTEKLDLIYFVLSEFESYGVKNIPKIKIPKAYNPNKHERILYHAEMKLAYQHLKAKKKFYERRLKLGKSKDESILVKPRDIELDKSKLKKAVFSALGKNVANVMKMLPTKERKQNKKWVYSEGELAIELKKTFREALIDTLKRYIKLFRSQQKSR